MQAAQVGPLQPGATWLAGKERAALVPVAVRVVLRGAQWPGAFVRVGDPCAGPELEAALEPFKREAGIKVEPGETSLEDVFIKFMTGAQERAA